MKYMLFAFLMILPTLALAQANSSTDAKQAEAFIRSLGDEAISALDRTKSDQSARRDEFKRILNTSFDTATIARFAMGRYWGTATEAEKTEYKSLFNQMVVDVYTKRFSEYTNQKFNVTGSKPAGNDVIVNSLITSQGQGQPIRVDWRVRRGKVIDVIVEGVSMSVTQRSEFASIIQRNGGNVSALINHLKK